jgi:hypothetical protein
MSPNTYKEVSITSAEKLAELATQDRSLRRELAAETVRAEMAAMEAAGKVLQLTDEEMRLLRSFRRFKAMAKKAGEVFKWQTRPLDANVLVVEGGESAHITDPQDVSGR